MIFWLLLAFFLIFFVVRPLLRGALFYRNLKKSFYRDFQQRRQPEPEHKTKKKIFNADEGEYVSFEEINQTSSTYRETIDDTGMQTSTTESQTVDAEWEDVK